MTEPINFVLVHGAWHGGWCYARVRDRLTAQGHRVFTPTLTGLGERSHLMSKDINLDTESSNPGNSSDFVELGENVYFSAGDGVNGFELWKSDGTPGGTQMVKDIRAGSGSSFPTDLTEVNGALSGITGIISWPSLLRRARRDPRLDAVG